MPQALPAPFRPFSRLVLRAWGKTGVAPGLLYQAIERSGTHLAASPRTARLFNGCEMVCDLREHIQRQIYFFGAYEAVEAYLFQRLVAPGMCVVDAGANVGQYTLIAARRVGPTGQVHAFEPVPGNFEKLTDHVRRNGLDARVRANPTALWDEGRELTLSLGADDQKDNATNYSVNAPAVVVNALTCPAVRLDDYARDRGMPGVDLIKMDIEGSELPALRGAGALIGAHRPTILMEINRAHSLAMGYEPSAIWEFLRPFGYSVRRIGGNPEECSPLDDLRGVERANVLFHARPLPPDLWNGWSYKGVLADLRSGRLAAT